MILTVITIMMFILTMVMLMTLIMTMVMVMMNDNKAIAIFS